MRLKECGASGARCSAANDRMKQRIQELTAGNAELKRRLADAKQYREQVLCRRYFISTRS